MKKSLFKLILGVFATMTLFSSCLGDSSNSRENPMAFAYITTKDGIQCAAMDWYYFTSPIIKTLTVGKCYILGYRTNLEMASSQVILAEDIAQPIELTTTYGRVDSPTVENTFNPSEFKPDVFFFNDYYGDNWSFSYRASLKEKDTPRAHCFYDVNRQYEMLDGVRKDVEKNQIIIDVRFDYVPGADGSTRDAYWYSVSNLSGIKSSYKENPEKYDPTKIIDNYVIVAVKFRYNQLQSDGTVKEDVYVGNWTSSPYSFAYPKE
ncbi:MAG: hypothetical protein LBL79_10365 [Prevotella sp.]|jgi:hypothetical protein|nr:hypothetical protein [Prevotella sp.]